MGLTDKLIGTALYGGYSVQGRKSMSDHGCHGKVNWGVASFFWKDSAKR